MGNIVQIRVELRNNPHSHDDRESGFVKMFKAFKRAVDASGIMHEYKERQTYESKSTKRRRKKRESQAYILKMKLRENLLQGRQGNFKGKSSSKSNWRNDG